MTTIILKLKYIVHPPNLAQINNFDQCTFFNLTSIRNFYNHNPTLYMIISVIFLFLFSLLFNYLIIREKLFQRNNLYPALGFIITTSLLSSTTIFNSVTIAVCINFIVFIKILSLSNQQTPRKEAYNIGLLLMLSSFFYFPSIFLILLFIIGSLILRPFVLQEYIAFLLGLLTPIYICFSILFLLNKMDYLNIINLQFNLPLNVIKSSGFILISIFFILLILYAVVLINKSENINTTLVRKKWNLVFYYIILSSVVGIFDVLFPSGAWLFHLVAISILIPITFNNPKNKKLNNFTFYSLLLIVLIVQWIIK